jgi:hypothetical protein
MSKQELVEAFLEGRISRRTFIRKLIASGVSAGAALAYAGVLVPAPAQAARRATGDFYHGHQNLSIPVRGTVKSPCSGEKIRLAGTVHITINTVITKSRQANFTYIVSYQGLSGTGVTSGKRYHGGGSRQFVEHLDLADFYPRVISRRQHFVLAGRRDTFRVSGVYHITADANGDLRATFDSLRSVDCLT